jgi:RNA polymerase sigma factor (sigma-70 family)
MNYEERVKKITDEIAKYRSEESEDLLNSIFNLLNPYIRKTIIKSIGYYNEDYEQEVYIKIPSWIKNKDSDGKYIIKRIIYFIKRYAFDNNDYTKGLTAREKYEFRTLYLNKNKNKLEEDRYEQLKSKTIYVMYSNETDLQESKHNIFDDVKNILNKDDYLILYSYYKENITYEDIGKMLNISKQAVDKKLKKILEKLKDELVID